MLHATTPEFNPKANPDVHPARLERDLQQFRDKVNRDGVWCVIGEYFDGEEWQHADSCFGFVGDDWKHFGYDTHIMRATLNAAKSVRVCRACKRPLPLKSLIQRKKQD